RQALPRDRRRAVGTDQHRRHAHPARTPHVAGRVRRQGDSAARRRSMTDGCESIDAYVDGELDDEQHAEFERHLSGCQSCMAELPRLLALTIALDAAAEAARGPRLALVDDEEVS